MFVYLFIYLFIYSFIFENILIYDISCKTSTGAEPLCIKYDEIDGFIKIRDIIQNLVLFDHGWFQKICDQITDSINHNFAKIIIDSYNYLPIEKTLTFS